MSKKNYSKTIIYKICCNDVNITDIYIGKTCDLIRRRNQHKHSCNNENNKNYNNYVYEFIRNNGGWDNWNVIPIEEYPCENINQSLIRERYWLEELKATLNTEIPSRTQKEWREDNKDHRKAQKKEYYENNKNKIKEKLNEKFTCECGGKYTHTNKSIHNKSKKHQDYLTQTIPA